MPKHLKKLEKLSTRIRECEAEMQNLKTLPYYTVFKQQAQQQKDLQQAGQRLEKLREKYSVYSRSLQLQPCNIPSEAKALNSVA